MYVQYRKTQTPRTHAMQVEIFYMRCRTQYLQMGGGGCDQSMAKHSFKKVPISNTK